MEKTFKKQTEQVCVENHRVDQILDQMVDFIDESSASVLEQKFVDLAVMNKLIFGEADSEFSGVQKLNTHFGKKSTLSKVDEIQ